MTKHLLGFLLLYTLSSCNLVGTPSRSNNARGTDDVQSDVPNQTNDVGDDVANDTNDTNIDANIDATKDVATEVGPECIDGSTCDSGVCEAGNCQNPTCSDGVKNGDESDIDCSGACDLCSTGEDCRKNADCDGGACTDGECRPLSCSDNLKNANESDVDCGGDCAPCNPGSACVANADCDSIICDQLVCTVARCGDGILNGTDACDSGPVDTATCNGDCTIPVCGDAIINVVAGETCDDGNTVTEACVFGVSSCTVCADDCVSQAGKTSVCGDAMLDPNFEVCDDGVNNGSPGSCLNNCSAAVVCGDNTVNGIESCDDGNVTTEVCNYGSTSCMVCNAMCMNVAGVTSYCGDGIVDPGNGEKCDDGNVLPGDGCDASCQGEIAGDCRVANGLRWCQDLASPDQSCNAICAASGSAPANDLTATAAQDTVAECTTIRDAFGVVAPIMISNVSSGCVAYRAGTVFACSDKPDCVLEHRTSPPVFGLFSICACDP